MWLRVRVMKIHSSIFLCINITFILSTECSVTENDSPWTTEDTLNILDYFIDVRETSFEESLLSKNRMPSIYSPHAQQFSRSWSAVSPALGGRCLLFPCRLQRAQGRLGHARLEALKEPPPPVQFTSHTAAMVGRGVFVYRCPAGGGKVLYEKENSWVGESLGPVFPAPT